jgi:SET domain-containing protein
MLLVPTRLAQSPIHGFGVFALGADRERHAGMALSPRVSTWSSARRSSDTLPAHVQTFFSHYGYLDRNMRRIILCFDDARFVNHSDTPNVATDYAQDPYGLDVALRDIAAGEELTMDYAGFEESAERGL